MVAWKMIVLRMIVWKMLVLRMIVLRMIVLMMIVLRMIVVLSCLEFHLKYLIHCKFVGGFLNEPDLMLMVWY